MKNILYKKLSIILLLLATSFVVVGCLDDEKVDFGKGPIIVNFPKAELSQNFLQDGSGKVYEYKVPIEYVGGKGVALDKVVSGKVEVLTSSTAKVGVEYDLVGDSFSIPAKESKGYITIKVNSKNLDSSDPKHVDIAIVSCSETVAEVAKVSIVLQAICPSALAGDYVYTTGRKRDVTITELSAGTYRVSCDDKLKGEYTFDITDVCGNLKVIGAQVEGYGYAVSGTGSVDAATGEISITYTIEGIFANAEMKMKKK